MLLLYPYEGGRQFIVKTDHEPLRMILNMKESSGRLALWQLRWLEFALEAQHRLGRKHMATDALSWLSTNQIDESVLDDDILAHVVDDVQIVTDFRVEKKVEPLTIHFLLWGQNEDINGCQLVDYANAQTVPIFTMNLAFFQGKQDCT